MTTQTEKSSSFLESFGRFLGQLPMGIQSPIMERRAEIEFQKQKRLLDEQRAREYAAIEQAGELIRQRDIVADYQQDPLQEGVHGVRPEWGETDDLRLLHAYREAGIDPEKRAKVEREQLVTDAFQRGIKGITNNAALVNIGMGKEYNPVQFEGGVFYNPYDTENFNLGSTAKHQAEAKLKQGEADEQALRLARIRVLTDPIMQLNATSNKELGKPIEAVVEKDGQSVKTLISQDSSGNYHHSVVTDRAGEPLVIPPEAAGDGLTSEQKNIKNRARLLGITEAEALTSLNDKSQYSDAGYIEYRLGVNSKDSFGRRNSDSKILNATFDDFVRSRYGSYFPEYFIEEANRSEDMTDVEKEAFSQKVKDYNQTVFEMQLAGQQQPPAAPAVSPPVIPAVAPVPALPAAATPATMPNAAPAMPAPAPTIQPPPIPEPAPLPEPSQVPDFTAFAEIVMTNNSPETINAALQKQGFDLSPQAMGVMAIDAINQGVSPRDIQQLYQLLGIKWTPPA